MDGFLGHIAISEREMYGRPRGSCGHQMCKIRTSGQNHYIIVVSVLVTFSTMSSSKLFAMGNTHVDETSIHLRRKSVGYPTILG